MSNWGKAHINNNIGFGQAALAGNGFGSVYDKSENGFTVLNYNFFTDATLAFSLRDLGLGATYVVRVRRDSDNAEQDFTANEITNGTLLSFVGSGNGFVTILYEQKNSSLNLSNNTSTTQPKIVNNGTLVSENGKPTILFDGNDDYLENDSISITQPNQIFIVYSHGNNNDNIAFDGRVIGERQLINNKSTGTTYYAGTQKSNNISPLFNQLFLANLRFDASNSFYKRNAIDLGLGNPGLQNLNGLVLGANININADLNGFISEFTIYDTIPQNENQIEQNILNYYEIS